MGRQVTSFTKEWAHNGQAVPTSVEDDSRFPLVAHEMREGVKRKFFYRALNPRKKKIHVVKFMSSNLQL